MGWTACSAPRGSFRFRRSGLRWQDFALNWRLAALPGLCLVASIWMFPQSWNPQNWDWSHWLTLAAVSLIAVALGFDYAAPLVVSDEHLYEYVPGSGWQRISLESVSSISLEIDREFVDSLGAEAVHRRLCLHTRSGVAKIWVHPRLDRKLIDGLMARVRFGHWEEFDGGQATRF